MNKQQELLESLMQIQITHAEHMNKLAVEHQTRLHALQVEEQECKTQAAREYLALMRRACDQGNLGLVLSGVRA